ncbi:MAG: hypothetical protein GXP63_05300 [DPANN group archaeon]|nr:hypothetical protein [DPANN group archaeon]
MGLIILFVILFSILAVMYLRDIRSLPGDVPGIDATTNRTAIAQSTTLINDILGKIQRLLTSKVENLSTEFQESFIVNDSIVMGPGECEFDRGFGCLDLQVDREGRRMYFLIKNRLPGDQVLKSIETVSGTRCDTLKKQIIIKRDEERSFILENCDIVNSTSVFKMTYFGITLSRGLERSTLGYYAAGK